MRMFLALAVSLPLFAVDSPFFEPTVAEFTAAPIVKYARDFKTGDLNGCGKGVVYVQDSFAAALNHAYLLAKAKGKKFLMPACGNLARQEYSEESRHLDRYSFLYVSSFGEMRDAFVSRMAREFRIFGAGKQTRYVFPVSAEGEERPGVIVITDKNHPEVWSVYGVALETTSRSLALCQPGHFLPFFDFYQTGQSAPTISCPSLR